ncbi:large-conductance mechanosensitive channel protein MscL [Akkermansiaceae bacterium]|jgi:large conductance mechanosensitive channel|nr:large-conductance mechanosensitive channel protein MscL [Akkermansiaceae bacterium]
MLKQFKEFAFKGNLIDMAVGIIIGGAFTVLVKSLVDNVFMPPLGALMAKVDFKNLTWTLIEADKEAGTKAVVISHGQFITDLISFMLMAFVVFIVIKKVIGAMQKEEVEEKTPEAPPKQEVLLEEIRDLLKQK